jgi:branched-chain amino acid transport system substrate-binding protein
MTVKLWAAIGIVMLALLPPVAASRAQTQGVIRIADDDAFSGGNGNVGEEALKEFVFYAEKINAAGGVNGMKLEITPFDNKSDPQEALVQAQKALDQGFRFIAQGVSASSVGAALTDFIAKHNDRNPGQEALYLNIAANDVSLTNDKCQYWHFRFSSNNDMKTVALLAYMVAQPSIKKVYLINPDYTAGRSVRDLATKILAQKRPDIEIVGNELHPVFKVSDFSPYIAKIKASGADAIISSAFSQDMALMLKAAAEAGLSADWYMFYAMNPGGPTAMKQANLSHRVYNLVDTFANNPAGLAMQQAFHKQYGFSMIISGAVVSTEYLVAAIQQTGSTDPVVIAKTFEGMRLQTFNGDQGLMRKDDHQFFQNLYLTTFAPVTAEAPIDEEATGWGWLPIKTIPAADTLLPTTCKMDRP